MTARGRWVLSLILLGLAPAARVDARVRFDPWLGAPKVPTPGAPKVSASHPEWVDIYLLGAPDLDALGRLGVRAHVSAGAVLTARVPERALRDLSTVPGLDGVMLAKPMQFLLDASIDSVHARSLRSLEPGGSWSGHTGHGVMVGIVDSGVDVTHDDFRFPDGTSRIAFFWDQTDTSGTPPAYGYGSEWTGSALLSTPRAWDPVGHGTHVAGIAAGDGSASQVDSLRYRFAGVAPDAELVAVAVDLSKDTNILDAVHYVFDRAGVEGKPAVVNLSLGNQFGPHDGMTPLEIGIDALVGPGRLVVAAGGNSGSDRVHAELHVTAGGRDSASVFVGPNPSGPPFLFFAVDAFHAAADSFDIVVVTPGGARFGPFGFEDVAEDTLTGQGTLFLDQAPYPTEPSRNEIALLVSNHDPGGLDAPSVVPAPASGEWRVVFLDRNGAAGGGEVDLWLALSSIRDQFGVAPYWLLGQDPGEEITAPGSARGVLTVGSFNTKPCWPDSLGQTWCTSVTPVELTEPGRITFFSSRGPTTDGREKPEIVAPGFVVASARSAQITPDYAPLYRFDRTLQPDREHFVYLGTSMSAPHLTGAAALALEGNAVLDPPTLRAALLRTGAHDQHAAAPWTPEAGYGKLDVAALLQDFVPVRPGELALSTGSSGRPHLEWRGGDETAFRLDSQKDGVATWEERARFPGVGEHAWDEVEEAPRWRYRLWSTNRLGQSKIWGEVAWTIGGALRWSQPSPNPFRESCAIVLTGSAIAGRGQLCIYDAAGRSVRRVDGLPGQTTLRWDGRNDRGRPVPPGVYWMEARVGPFRRAVRVVRIP